MRANFFVRIHDFYVKTNIVCVSESSCRNYAIQWKAKLYRELSTVV